MGARWPDRFKGQWLEAALAATILACILNAAIHAFRFGYLPAPFFFETWDTFGDWFNTGFWAREPGAYDSWKTIYLPLSFVFHGSIGPDYCYQEFRTGMVARHCDYVSISVIFIILLLNIFLTWRVMKHMNSSTAPMRTICVALGYPMLFAVERGNLLILTYTCLLLALTPVLASARLRWLFAGLAINFKVYLIAAVVPLLLKRRWRWVEGALLAAVLVYLVSFAIFGHGTPVEIYENIRDFSLDGPDSILDMWFTTTYQPLLLLMENDRFPFAKIIGSQAVDLVLLVIPKLVLLTQGLIALAALAIWYRPDAFTTYRAVALGLLFVFVSVEPGGYTMICLLLFVMLEPWKRFGQKWAIVACYILAMPIDIPIDVVPEAVRHLYFRDTTTLVQHEIILGPFLRPAILMTMAWALSLTTLRELWDEMRLNQHLPWHLRKVTAA